MIGQLAIGDGTGSSTLTIINSSLLTGGNVTLASGSTLNLGSQQLTLYNSSSLSGTGTLLLNSTTPGVVFGTGSTGGIAPGSTLVLDSSTLSSQIGTLTLDSSGNASASLQLASTSNSNFDIGSGSSYDQVNLGGTSISYDGTLTLNFTDGNTPTVGTTYQLFQNSGSTDGTFTSITSNMSDYSFSFDESSGVLTVEAIPEPSIACLMALGCCGMLATIRLFPIRQRA